MRDMTEAECERLKEAEEMVKKYPNIPLVIQTWLEIQHKIHTDMGLFEEPKKVKENQNSL